MRLPVIPLTVAALLSASPALAHHSFAAYEDPHTRTLEGTLQTFQWSNPHVLLTVLVSTDPQNGPQVWNIVTSGPSILTRFGWRRNSLQTGARVRMVCNPLRNGTHGCRLHTLTLLDTGQIFKTKLSSPTESGE